MRTPYALLSDDAMDRDLVNHVHFDNMRKVQAMRNKATQAWAESQDEMAIQRAVSTRTRTTDRKEIGQRRYRLRLATHRRLRGLGWTWSGGQPDRQWTLAVGEFAWLPHLGFSGKSSKRYERRELGCRAGEGSVLRAAGEVRKWRASELPRHIL